MCGKCPSNSTALSGSDKQEDCMCDAGYTGANGEDCVNCVAGKYKTIAGNATCIHCPVGTYSTNVSSQRSQDCLSCAIGNTHNLTG